MSQIGDVEKRTQARLVRLFQDELHYEYLGDLSESDNHNIIEARLEQFLFDYQGMSSREEGPDLVRRAITAISKAANDTSLDIYDRNREVYRLLRYPIKVKTGVGEATQDVWLIDWKNPERNRFAVARKSPSALPTQSHSASGRTSSSTSTASRSA